MQSERDALRRLNWTRWRWVVALIFLVNPYIRGFDLLPDFVGYWLLLSGLRRVSLLDDSFREASRLLRRLAFLSVAQMVGRYWITTVPNAEEQPTLILLLCFAVGVLELILVLPACRQMFHGLSYIAARMGGPIILSSTREEYVVRLQQRIERLDPNDERTPARRQALERKMARFSQHEDITARACRRCQTFAIVKAALCVLPELTALADVGYDMGAVDFPWYNFIGGFRTIAILATLVVGAVWLIRTARYCLRIEQDHAFWEALVRRCDEDDAAHPERLPARRLRVAVGFALAAFAFCSDFSLDGINVLPGFMTSLLLLFALGAVRAYLPRRVRCVATSVLLVHTAIAGASYIMTVFFFDRHDLNAYFRSGQVQSAYDTLCAVSVVETLATVAVFVVLAIVLAALTQRYASGQTETSEGRMRSRRSKRLNRSAWGVLVFGILSALAHTAYDFLLPYYDFVWLPDIFLSLLLLVAAWLRLPDLIEELDTRRMVEDHF